MDLIQEISIYILQSGSLANFVLALSLIAFLALLLAFGRRLQPAIQLERLGIPIALLAGLLGILLGPYGPIPLLPESVTKVWLDLPTPLLTLVFATLLLGRPLPRAEEIFRPLASQTLLGLVLGFGQYVVGGLVVLFVLAPQFGVDPLMGCLIEVGFEGGHGAAAVMAKSFNNFGFETGKDLGLAMATIGLLASTLFGSGLVVLARWRGWIYLDVSEENSLEDINELDDSFLIQLRQLLLNLAFIGTAVLIGIILLNLLHLTSAFFGDNYSQIINVFPVFPLALIGSLIVRMFIQEFRKTNLVSHILQREISTLATDVLITTAMASINIPLLQKDWISLTALSVSGLAWNLIVMLMMARYIFNTQWFERSIVEFGNATGVTASGLLLLRLSDPNNKSGTLSIFSVKQLLLQPLLSGGIITLFAPIAVESYGLIGWTEFCGVVTLIFIALALFISTTSSK